MKIAVDVMGTDYGPAEIIKGVLQAVKEYGCDAVLVGDEDVIKAELRREHEENNPHVTIHHASEVIEMKDHPGISVKKKRDASIVVASLTGATVLLDSGAKVDAKPEQLVQSAIMGSVYAESQLGIKNPRVGLLNIGEEETKGNEQCLATYPLLKANPHIHFIGNVEGRDINKGTVDVVVCDGFTGNVVLKTMEGLGSAVLEIIRSAVKGSGFLSKFGALLMKPALTEVKRKMDASEYGGAPFIICHGSSKAKAIKNAVRVAIELTEKDIVGKIGREILRDEESGEL